MRAQGKKSDRRFFLNDGVLETGHQDASIGTFGLIRFINFTGPYPAARFRSDGFAHRSIGGTVSDPDPGARPI